MENSRRVALYTNRPRSLTLIRTEDVDSEIGRCPLPWGVVVSKEEKRRTLALSLTHRVGRVAVLLSCGVAEGSPENPTDG